MSEQSGAALHDIARAKVNLTLSVTGRRTDGFHDLESFVAFADCADDVSITGGEALSLATTGARAQECGELETNLVMKAARLLAERVSDLNLGRFALDKRLPVAAGIGGGSADAAAALRLLARLNNIALDDERLIEAARLTGADVPVCLQSQACIMTGIGETLTPMAMPRMDCVLVNPRVPVATADVFRELGMRKGALRVGVTDVLRAPAWPAADASFDQWIDALKKRGNDLEAPAQRVEPVIALVLGLLHTLPGARLARMSGSGATCFALFADDNHARAAASRLRDENPGWWVHAGVLG